jgi:cell division protein FtsW
VRRKSERLTRYEAGVTGAFTTESIRHVERVTVGRAWPRLDYILAVTVGALLLIGLTMVYSSTFDMALQANQSPTTYLMRQSIGMAIGLVILFFMAWLDYSHLHRISIPLLGVVLASLLLVLIIGQGRFGATRTFLNGSLQPSELAKLAVVIYIADWLSSKGEKIRDISYGLVPFGVLIGVIAGLIVLEPNFSTALLVVATAGIMFFLAGAELKQIVGGSVIAAFTFGLLIMNSAHGRERISSFTSMFSDAGQTTWQLQQSLVAIGSGGLLGHGLGTSQQKLGYLPLPHSDSIFAVLGEEMGLIGCLIVIGLFAVLAYRGFKIASQATDVFGALLAAGATSWLVLEAVFNVAAMTGLMPFTGIPLPFISYGRSSLVSAMAAVGILLSVSRGTRRSNWQSRQSSAAFDLGRRDGRSRVSRAGSR